MDADELLDELVHYIRWHFKCEEQLMKIYDIPDADDHKAKHADLLRMIQDKRELIRTGKNGHRIFLDFFDTWFAGHSFGFDKNWGRLCVKSGILRCIRVVGCERRS